HIPTSAPETPHHNDRGVLLSDGRNGHNGATTANRPSAAKLAERSALPTPNAERSVSTSPTAERLAGLAARPSLGSPSGDAPAGRVRLSGMSENDSQITQSGSTDQDAADRQAKTALQVQSLLA